FDARSKLWAVAALAALAAILGMWRPWQRGGDGRAAAAKYVPSAAPSAATAASSSAAASSASSPAAPNEVRLSAEARQQNPVSSDREREVAEAQAASEEAALDAARQRLESLGFRAPDLAKMGSAAGGRVAIRAPIDGVVISREVTLGQAVQAATDAFRVANLR